MMNWIIVLALLLTFRSQTLAQNGYNYQQPIKPFNGDTTHYPDTIQPERPGIGTTPNKYPDNQQTSGSQNTDEHPGSQRPGSSQTLGGYPGIQGSSGTQSSGGYPGSQQQGAHIPQKSGGYPEAQGPSSPGVGSFTGYPSGRPEGSPFPQQPGDIGPQGPHGRLGEKSSNGHPENQQVSGPQRPTNGYSDTQRPTGPQNPTGYPRIEQPSSPGTAIFNGYPSGRPEPSFPHRPDSIDRQPQGHRELQKPTGAETPNGPQRSNGLQRPHGSQIPSGPKESQGSTRYFGQPSVGYPTGSSQGPASFPSTQRPGKSGVHETQGSFPSLPSLPRFEGSQGTSEYSGGQRPNGLQGPNTSQSPGLGQQKPYPDIQSPSKPPNSYISPVGFQRSDGTTGGPRGPSTPQKPPSPMYSRPGGGSQEPGEPGAFGRTGSSEVGELSRTYLPGEVGLGASHPVGPGFSGIPITPDASGRSRVLETDRGSSFPNVPGVSVASPVSSTSGLPGASGVPSIPDGSFPNISIGSLTGAGGAGILDEGKYEEGDYSAIPGEPDIDYPIYSAIPDTSFNCEQQQYPGYYADVETRCQIFHICANNKTYDFLCPNGTIFHQEYLVCVWWNQFDCNLATSLYEINAKIYNYFTLGQLPDTIPSGALSPSGYPGQGLGDKYSSMGDGHLISQGPSGPQEHVGPTGPDGSREPGTQQEPTASQGPGEPIYTQSSSSTFLEPQQPSISFSGSGRPGTPSREYLPQITR